jgi:hypothetical protein
VAEFDYPFPNIGKKALYEMSNLRVFCQRLHALLDRKDRAIRNICAHGDKEGMKASQVQLGELGLL